LIIPKLFVILHKQENLDAVLKRLDQLGVTVTEEHKEDNNSQNSLRHSKKAKNIDQKDVSLYERKRKSYIRNGERYEGLEDELLPDVRISVSKGARTYLEGMVNYGLHSIVVERETEKDGEDITVTKHAIDIGPNPYYWTKFQCVKSKKVPKRMYNPSYKKLKDLME
jgi:vacuolar-type H+-ATPase subunit I/STV1